MSFFRTETPANAVFFGGFNQNSTCFACGTKDGFQIFNCDHFKESFQRQFPDAGGIHFVEMLFQTNILALVEANNRNKVKIWDDRRERWRGEITLRQTVEAVRLRADKVAVVLEVKIVVYELQTLKQLTAITTMRNRDGLCAFSSATERAVLACPGLHPGTVRVELLDIGKTTLIEAHSTGLRAIVLSYDGQFLATASERGTLIRIWDAVTGERLHEVRRGFDTVTIHSMSFSSTNRFLAVSSSHETIHVFKLDEFVPSNVESDNAFDGRGPRSPMRKKKSKAMRDREDEATTTGSRSSSLGLVAVNFLTDLSSSYMSSTMNDRSFAQYRMKAKKKKQSVVTFGSESDHVQLFVACEDGKFYELVFDSLEGGECVIQTVKTFA